MVACRPILPGEELTHSYVEIVEGRPTRQEKLLQSYGFRCNCVRCSYVGPDSAGSAAVEIEACYSSGSSVEQDGMVQMVTVPIEFAETGSYQCFLPSHGEASPQRTALCVETAGTVIADGVSVRIDSF